VKQAMLAMRFYVQNFSLSIVLFKKMPDAPVMGGENKAARRARLIKQFSLSP